MTHARGAAAGWTVGGLLFLLLATANSGGYRFGVSDQAVHVPAVMKALDPASFPRDAPVLDAQARLTVFYDAVADTVRATGASVETVFISGYVLTVALVWIALLLIGGRLYSTPWALVALAAIVTLRHRIPKTSVNSFEPYFYPRSLAFAVGLVAIAFVLHRRTGAALAMVLVSAVVHPTTGLWFGILIGVASLRLDTATWHRALAGGMAATAAGALVAGPLSGSLVRMDAGWLAALQSKDDLFPSEWPLWVWAANLALPLLLVWVHRTRQARGDATREDTALVTGGLALAAFFLATLPAVAARWALPTQLQASRVFWLIEFLAVIYLVALIAEHLTRSGARRALPVAAGVMLALSAARGAYVMGVEFPERPLFETHLRQTPWVEAMQWLKRQPPDVHVWADPGHAWKYGSSVRVAAGRDVFVEETKDSAIAIYSRPVAARVVERLALPLTVQFNNMAALDPALVRAMADRYDLDYLVTESRLTLQPVFENSQFRIYRVGRLEK